MRDFARGIAGLTTGLALAAAVAAVALAARACAGPGADAAAPLRPPVPGEIRGPSPAQVDRALNGGRSGDWID